MYDVMMKDRKKKSLFKQDNFFGKMPDEESVKIVTSYKMAESLEKDMKIFSDFMTKTILEGILNGG